MGDKLPRIPPYAMRYLTIGVEFIAVFLIFVAIGFAIDQRWGRPPIFTMVGMVIGFAAAMYRLLRLAQDHDWGRKGPPDEEDE